MSGIADQAHLGVAAPAPTAAEAELAVQSKQGATKSRGYWAGVGLRELWQWDEAQFLHRTEGSPIRRMGYQRWRRNLAVVLGNACAAGSHLAQVRAELQAAHAAADALVREHIAWALAQGPA